MIRELLQWKQIVFLISKKVIYDWFYLYAKVFEILG